MTLRAYVVDQRGPNLCIHLAVWFTSQRSPTERMKASHTRNSGSSHPRSDVITLPSSLAVRRLRDCRSKSGAPLRFVVYRVANRPSRDSSFVSSAISFSIGSPLSAPLPTEFERLLAICNHAAWPLCSLFTRLVALLRLAVPSPPRYHNRVGSDLCMMRSDDRCLRGGVCRQ